MLQNQYWGTHLVMVTELDVFESWGRGVTGM